MIPIGIEFKSVFSRRVWRCKGTMCGNMMLVSGDDTRFVGFLWFRLFWRAVK